ncbi:response regulator transcription factor [Cesiribacter sp. SM1]|uniref:response regulator n=1 Tax=Cesiribacter sp. SM1 TaxID=2861196 RepID=UPI001CD3A12E|nr:response regulator transcription factor [Cesiribacter sp. SM1]
MIKVLIYDDNKPLREGLSMLISGSDGFVVAGTYPNCNQVAEEVSQHRPDVVLMDINMPGIGGLAGLQLIKNSFPGVKVVMLTVFDDNQTVFDAMKAGADGYLLKKTPPAKLLEYLQDVYGGGAAMTASVARQVLQLFAHPPVAQQITDYQLSEREKDVLQWLVNGYSYKLIAAELHISLETVRSHIKKIYEKLQVHSKTEAVSKAYRDRLV